ncbi:MAG: DNA-3-methyladenine glycosylase [Candidatus Neomarinimicrobiota bacterium]|jgi:DNA-3-methyladenine glycosylase
MSKVLNKSFYTKDLHVLAKALLGKLLVHTLEDGQRISGHIVELEAYAQKDDPASHSFNGKTDRNALMFESPGNLYVYLIYGMYHCCNVVSGPKGLGDAILIRALQPHEGIDIMQENRHIKTATSQAALRNLSNGPGKLSQALSITKEENGLDLCTSNVQIENSNALGDFSISCSRRIGISKGKNLKWRYFIQNNSWVSKAPKGIISFEQP